MSIETKINLNTHYTRSVNLERDVDSRGVVEAYIPTSRALSTLGRIAETFGDHEAPRAWALVGPYGSGKSSFAVFLSHLLGPSIDPTQKLASKILKGTDATIAKSFASEIRGSDGYCHVLLTGSPEPLAKRFCECLFEAAENFWASKRGRTPAIVDSLQKLARKNDPKVTEILDHIEELQYYVANAGGKGVLIVFDEFGKYLEYEARHYGANDIYLLQALAEHAFSGNDSNLYIFVLLHQAFEQYANGLGDTLKNEWAKVQGRFENIPFLESAEQVLRIVSAAFNHQFSGKEQKLVRDYAKNAASILHADSALPSVMGFQAASEIFCQCYPLHPVSVLLLPVLCQKVAQNERTLFSYLGSNETHGFKDSLRQLPKVGEWIYPWEIYDYFILNQPAALTDHYTHRRWAEVVTAIERLGDAAPEHIQLLKTIGLLNIIGVQGGFKASKKIIRLCLSEDINFNKTIKSLTDKSIIQFRKFSGEYRVWQGSDFDMDGAVEQEVAQYGQIDLADELNKRKSFLPIVARKYTIQKGALRYFQPIFADAQNHNNIPSKSSTPRIIFYLSATKSDQEIFTLEVITHFGDMDLVVLCQNGNQLRKVVEEVIALQRVRVNRQELNTDPIAQREFKDRLASAESKEDELLASLIEYPEDHVWYWNEEAFKVKNKRDLQNHLTETLEAAYYQSPIIQNELINRDAPSAQANAARNKLLFAMMQHEEKKDLGIEKFPAEKAIYRSVLRETKLHRGDNNGVWQFVEPTRKTPFYQVWKRINEFLDSTEKQAKSFADLNDELMSPPYGIKAGILPILYIAVYQVYQHELALYEEKRYRPFFDEEMLERFVKRPDLFTFQRFRIEGLNASIFKQYSKVIHKDTKKRTILDLARPLATFMGKLPGYVQITRRGLTKNALAVRNAFNLAKSPEQLLFIELPKALGYEGLHESAKKSDLEGFASALTDTLRDLGSAYQNLLETQKELLAQAFNHDSKSSLTDLRRLISGNCEGLENYTVDTQGLRAFIMRLTKQLGTDQEWFENILMFLGHKPSKKWLDSDQDAAEYRLSDFSRRVIDLEKLRLHEKDRTANMTGDFDVYLLRSIKKGGDIVDEVVAIDEKSKKLIKDTREEIQLALANLPDNELMLATLAETVDDFLKAYRENQQKTNITNHKKRGRKPKTLEDTAA